MRLVLIWAWLMALALFPLRPLSNKVSINLGDDLSVIIKSANAMIGGNILHIGDRGTGNGFGGSSALAPLLGSSFATELTHQSISDMDDVGVDRVVDLLRSNVRQWSFVESQLMEPNVNLAMPEIFIPLRHLATTLELLGNILFIREDDTGALHALERACPLMELLPRDMISQQQQQHGATSSSVLHHLMAQSHHPQPHQQYQQHHGQSESSGLSRGCYALLRQVYSRENLVVSRASEGGGDFADGLSKLKMGVAGPGSSPVAALSSLDLFDVDRRFAELRSTYSHLRSVEEDGDGDGDVEREEESGATRRSRRRHLAEESDGDSDDQGQEPRHTAQSLDGEPAISAGVGSAGVGVGVGEEPPRDEGEVDRGGGPQEQLERCLRRLLRARSPEERADVLEEAEMILDIAFSKQHKHKTLKRTRREGRAGSSDGGGSGIGGSSAADAEEEEERFDVSLGRAYVAAMQQVAREGLAFVDAERSQLSLALALSFSDGELQMSGTDRNRLAVLDAISDATAAASATPAPPHTGSVATQMQESKSPHPSPFAVADPLDELVAALFEPPLPPPPPASSKAGSSPDAPRRRTAQEAGKSVENVVLGVVCFGALFLLLYLLHAEGWRMVALIEKEEQRRIQQRARAKLRHNNAGANGSVNGSLYGSGSVDTKERPLRQKERRAGRDESHEGSATDDAPEPAAARVTPTAAAVGGGASGSGEEQEEEEEGGGGDEDNSDEEDEGVGGEASGGDPVSLTELMVDKASLGVAVSGKDPPGSVEGRAARWEREREEEQEWIAAGGWGSGARKKSADTTSTASNNSNGHRGTKQSESSGSAKKATNGHSHPPVAASQPQQSAATTAPKKPSSGTSAAAGRVDATAAAEQRDIRQTLRSPRVVNTPAVTNTHSWAKPANATTSASITTTASAATTNQVKTTTSSNSPGVIAHVSPSGRSSRGGSNVHSRAGSIDGGALKSISTMESPVQTPIAVPVSSSLGPLVLPPPPLRIRPRGPQDDFGSALTTPSAQMSASFAAYDQSASITIALMLRCLSLAPASNYTIRVASAYLGQYELSKALPMRRSIVDPGLWVLTLRVPQFSYGGEFLYKYFAVDCANKDLVLEEPGEPRRIFLGDKDNSVAVEQEDLFATALQLLLVTGGQQQEQTTATPGLILALS